MNRKIELGANPLSEDEKFEIIVKYHGDIIGISRELGIETEILSESYAIMTLDRQQLESVRSFTQIEYTELPKTLAFVLSAALSASCVSSVKNRFNLTGAGTVIGIIDSGIDYTHPDFRNPDGTTRILYFWDQTAQGRPPTGFTAGYEYTKEDLDLALGEANPLSVIPELDTVGHGTAVAGVAAGNGRASGGRNAGVAPGASLIVVRLGRKGSESFARSTEIMRSVKYIIDKATELNMPLSINLSYGTNEGSHDGNSLFETYIDSMAQRWKTVISAATGNEGFAGHHFRGTATAGLMQTVEFSTISNLSSFYLTLWKNFVDTMFFELIGPSGESTGVIRPENAFTFATVDNTEVIIVYGEPTEYSEAQEVFFQLTGRDFAIPAGIWRLNIYPSVIVDGVYDIWLPVIEMVTADTAFRLPDPGITLTLPSTAKNVISVGGYNSLINAMTDFSGRGYTRSIKYVKPDLVAPAVGILSTSAGGGYDAFSGTSIAAPFVTGSSSLLMEWGIIRGNDIYLYGQRIKALLQKGARRRSGITYPNPAWGYGSLCLLDTFNLLT